MPLHGKIVVIKRSGGDGTEFPLTATCLFGRKPDCDIRIQLPQVSKEHCRIDFNENKEIILTNLSSVNPTRVNGEALQQSERLKHGDVITVIDRSFRFEYPPAPTPKKRSSIGGKTETFKVLQNQQVGDTVTTETGEKRICEVSTDPHLKDGTNHDNIQCPLEKTVEAKEDDGLLQSKTASPFNDLYQMIKKSLDVKTPRKSSASVLQTPTSRFCTPKPGSVRNNDGKPVISTEVNITPQKAEAKGSSVADEAAGEAGNVSNGTPKSVTKQTRSFQVPSSEMAGPEAVEADRFEATSPQKRIRTPPKRFSPCEAVEQVSGSPKSPVRRRSKEVKPAGTKEQEEQAVSPPKTDRLRKASPRSSGEVETVTETSKKRIREELEAELPASQMKKKRVSFGGFLCPELFDKRLPPDSPLSKGASPRRSMRKDSLLRRASVIGLLQHPESPKRRTPSPKKSSSSKNTSPKTPTTGKTSPKSRSPSPKAATPAKRSPKSKSPSPANGKSPTVQGRFSVSHIDTPSPIAEEVPAAPKVPLRRKSTSRETPSQAKSAAKVIRRRSGISRASMKGKNSWADIVRFGQTKAQVAAPAKKTVGKKTMKKTVSKPQTPARNLKGHVSTGHADSPVTIVVGRAHKQKVVHPTGGAPKLVPNLALFKKHMKIDEDLTGISEMLKTPGNERRKTSVIDENDAQKPLVGGLATSVVEPSVLNTPEEPGEMMVSPLTVSATVKDRSYTSEAVQRLFDNDQESSIVSDGPAFADCNEQQCTDLKTTSVATPKQKPELPECLTGVKRMMKTPRQKAEPIEDLRGKILKTPKQKVEIQECLTGVKRMMTTPRQEAAPVEATKEGLLTTPKQKPEQQGGLTEIKIICKTPQLEAEPLEDQEKPQTPKALEAGTVLVKTPEDLSEKGDMPAENVKSSPLQVADQASLDCDEAVAKELVFAHEEPRDDVPTDVVHDVPQVDVTMEADANEVVVDDHIEELPSGHDDNEPSDAVEISQAAVDENVCVEKPEVDTVDEKLSEEQPDVEAATVTDMETATEPDHETSVLDTAESLAADAAAHCDEAVVPTPVRARRGKKTEATAPPAVRQTTRGRKAKSQGSSSDDQPETPLETESDQTSPVTENESSPPEEEAVVKPTRGRKSKQTPVEPPQPEQNKDVGDESLTADAQPQKSIPVLEKPRRGRKPKPDTVEQNEVAEDTVIAVETKQQSQTPVRAKRGRHAKQEEEKPESSSAETTKSQEPAKKMRRTKKAEQNQASEDQAEMVQEIITGIETVPESENQQSPPADINHEASNSAAPLEKEASKPKRGRKAKQPETSVTEQQDVPTSQSEDVPQADTTKEMDAAVQRKAGRGRRAKLVESNSAEDEQEAAAHCDEAVVPTPVRARRGKKPEATAPPAVRQTTRGRKAKSQGSSSVDQPETTLETVSDQTSPITENESSPPEEEAVVKPTRGRKSKQTPVEPPQPEQNKDVGDESLTADAQPQKSIPVLEKPRRGRKPKPDTVEQNEVTEDTVIAVETKQQSQTPVRAKRGRHAKQEEEKPESSSVETTKSQEPAKKMRRTKKAEPEDVEPREEVHAIETPKPKRGGRKAAEVQETNEVSQAIPAKRARRGAALPLEETDAESTVQVSEPAAASVEPAKRGRRAAAKPTEELSKAVVKDTKTSKRSIKWKADFEVIEIPKVTPVKAVRGRKSKLGGQVVTESKTVPKAAEEMDLSDQVVEAQLVKRTRRGPKVADEVSSSKVKSVEADAPPKTRKGRSAKK